MPKYLGRKCPKCRDPFWFVLNYKSRSPGERIINAYCALCGYRVDSWRLIIGGMGLSKTLPNKMRKVFT